MHETTIPTANGSTPSNDMRSAESVEVTEPLPVVDPVPEWPTVSIIIPVRNEMCHISECLDALLAQDYPRELMEVICVDGYSDDGTRAIVDEYIAGNPHLSLLDNPGRIVSPAMNAGISAAQGDIVIRIDARCIVEQDYVRQCVRTLQQTGAQNVGGPQVAVGLDSVQAQAIAVATTSPVGIGNSKFRYATEPQFVDTVYLGSYPRAVFRRIGLYDEQLLRNQDYELNHRLRKAGGKIYFTPLIRSVYYSRPTLRRLWRQYFQYGFWKVHTLRLHPDSLKWRQMVAAGTRSIARVRVRNRGNMGNMVADCCGAGRLYSSTRHRKPSCFAASFETNLCAVTTDIRHPAS